ncbi:MAG: FAD-dependent oxidoreductase [Alphaproteobacteria bacterium]
MGSGISGLATAWLLARYGDGISVDLYEAADRLGGHVNTVEADVDGIRQAVDTGFIVHNPLNFPNIVALFETLGVATEDSDMSFAVSASDGRREYAGGRGPSGLFAQTANLANPSFHRMLREILQFNRAARADIGIADDVSLGDWLDRRGFSEGLADDYLLPMAAAIWSATTEAIRDFPAASLFRFLDAHGLLRIFGRPQWRTVTGGCRRYVDAIIRNFPGNVHLSSPVSAVLRRDEGVSVRIGGGLRRYDAVVMATHADTTLALLDDADDAERDILGRFGFAANQAVLHRDPAFMPRRKRAWASWNYLTGDGTAFVTYWMNRLQNITAVENLFVTLDPPTEPRDVIAAFDYAHPQFDAAAVAAQKRLPDIQGRRATWFCGAWTGYGFHEDGLRSALRVAADFGVAAPWATPLATAA